MQDPRCIDRGAQALPGVTGNEDLSIGLITEALNIPSADNNYIQSLIDGFDLPCHIIDLDHRVIFANSRMREITGSIPADTEDLRCYEIARKRSRPCRGSRTPCPFKRVLIERSSVTVRHLVYEDLFYQREIEVTASPLMDDNGGIRHILETFRDRTDYGAVDSGLRQSEALFRSIFDQSGDAIFILRAEGPGIGKIVAANKAACSMLGYGREELLRLYITDLQTPEHAAKTPRRIGNILAGETLTLETTYRKKDGTVVPVEVSASRMNIGERKYVIASYRNIALRKEVEQQRDELIGELRRISRTDGLTGLLNRRHMDIRLEEEMERARRYGNPLSLLIFDIDYFKEINDTYGHIFGDAVLKKTASIINEEIRGTDIAGRFGGDEFVIILVQTDIETGMQVAARLRQKIGSTTIEACGRRLNGFTISTGVSTFRPEMESPQTFIEDADRMLYEAKKQRPPLKI
jgi:diguanylate cyclase (GGDEF)-like protein/PAS domain S-box-containing protein